MSERQAKRDRKELNERIATLEANAEKEARKLIEIGEYRVEEAAREVGFFNTSFFTFSSSVFILFFTPFYYIEIKF